MVTVPCSWNTRHIVTIGHGRSWSSCDCYGRAAVFGSHIPGIEGYATLECTAWRTGYAIILAIAFCSHDYDASHEPGPKISKSAHLLAAFQPARPSGSYLTQEQTFSSELAWLFLKGEYLDSAWEAPRSASPPTAPPTCTNK